MKKIPPNRLFDKRVEVYNVDQIADGFGGFSTGNAVLIATRWAYVRGLSDVSLAQYRDQYGISTDTEILRFTFRQYAFNQLSQFLIYRGDAFRILVVNPNDQYEVSQDVIASRIPVPTAQ